jgi:hypothetical protein
MSSPEFAGLHGISGTAVAKRCALLMSPAKRQLIWWIQGLSLTEGGLRRLAKGLLNMFPDRLHATLDEAVDAALSASMKAPFAVNVHAGGHSDESKLDDEQKRRHLLDVALGRYATWNRQPPSMEDFLVDLCINPRLRIPLRVEGVASSQFETERAQEEFPQLQEHDFRDAELEYFKDVIGALAEFKRRYEESARAGFYLTEIGKRIWHQLDDALKTRSMIVIEGLEGRGKTEAARAWCECHLGVARFVSLKGISTKTAQFRKLAGAVGIGHGRSRKAGEMEAGVEEVLGTSGLMAVIDEAHFFFNQGSRVYKRPEMLDWIDTELCNPPRPVALLTTPQFMTCMERAAVQVDWNYRQFKRRCKRFVRLPQKNTPEDIEALARKLLPGADRAAITKALGYVALSKRDLSALGDVVREAGMLAEADGAKRVGFEHVDRAIREVLLLSDVPWAEMEARIRKARPSRRTSAAAPDSAPDEAAPLEPGVRQGSLAGGRNGNLGAVAGRPGTSPNGVRDGDESPVPAVHG